MLDTPDPNHHDWRGIACAMNLSCEDVRRLENDRDGKMKGLIERMIQRHKTVNDLLAWLRHPDVERLDVIDEIRKEPNTISDALLKTESSESQQSGLFLLFASVEVYFILFKNVTSHVHSNPIGESAAFPPSKYHTDNGAKKITVIQHRPPDKSLSININVIH